MSEGAASDRIAFVISAPSGAGKTTLAEELLARVPRLTRTVSCTTRPAREGEQDGKDYFFLTEEQFESLEREGEFLESAHVHGNRYGTLRSQIRDIQDRGDDAVLVIDVQGAEAVRQHLEGAVTVFVLPPSFETLARRLVTREGLNVANHGSLLRRLGVAGHEIAQYVGYDYLVINDEFETAAKELEAIVVAERCRRSHRAACAEAIRASFEGDAPILPQPPESNIDEAPE